ncbi:hypothetical protein [Haliangium sp.]|uniref:hypothetical protein n=1 Tax=Haliangium sp. TaxID=2663208 RepID=UPI003D12E7B9
MRTWSRRLFVALLAVVGLGCDNPFAPSERYVLREIAAELPDKLCREGTVYRDCWSFSREDCLMAAHEHVAEAAGILARSRNRGQPLHTGNLEQELLMITNNIYGYNLEFLTGFRQPEGCKDESRWYKLDPPPLPSARNEAPRPARERTLPPP